MLNDPNLEVMSRQTDWVCSLNLNQQLSIWQSNLGFPVCGGGKGIFMSELSREVIQELMHLNAFRKIEGPMQEAHEALFRSKFIEFADKILDAVAEREELRAKLTQTELLLKEVMATMDEIKNAVSRP